MQHLSHMLAGQKGSDVSAREATRKIVAARRQLALLASVLHAAGIAPSHELSAAAAADDAARVHGPRNTIVRSVLKGLHRA